MIESLPKTFALRDNDVHDLRIPSVEAMAIVAGSAVIETDPPLGTTMMGKKSGFDSNRHRKQNDHSVSMHPFKLDNDFCSGLDTDGQQQQQREQQQQQQQDVLTSVGNAATVLSEEKKADDSDSSICVVNLGSATPLHQHQETTYALLQERPFHVSVTVCPSGVKDDATGIVFVQKDGAATSGENVTNPGKRLVIQHIDESSIFFNTPLRVGDEVVSINSVGSNILCRQTRNDDGNNNDGNEDHDEDHNEDRDEDHDEDHDDDGDESHYGETAESLLDWTCSDGDTATMSTKPISSTGMMTSWTIVVENHGSSNRQLQWTTVTKPSCDSRLGLGIVSMSKNENAAAASLPSSSSSLLSSIPSTQPCFCDLRVQQIKDTGLLAHSLLNVGDRILYLNETCCFDDNMTLFKAASLLQSSTQITIVTPSLHKAPTSSSVLTSSPMATIPRPGFISVCIPFPKQQGQKQTQQQKQQQQQNPTATASSTNITKSIGLDWQVMEDALIVTSIDRLGPLAESPIQIGDRVLSINHVDCTDCQSILDVEGLLRYIESGTIMLVLQTQNGDPTVVASMITKPTPSSMVGIVVRQRRRDGLRRTVVSKIVPQGLLHNSLITVGDRLLAINGNDCSGGTLSVHDAVDHIKRSRDVVTIVTSKTQGDAAAVIAATGRLRDVLGLLNSAI